MLTLYRRHTRDCTFFGKNRHAKGANACAARCPIWVQGTLRGETIRRSLNLTSWEAASDWEAEEHPGETSAPVDAVARRAVAEEPRRRRGASLPCDLG
jgi:hypothetical protein